MKIRTIHLRNFQSHAETVINLSNGVNVIVGSSDEGKSAIIRALDAVLRNEIDNSLVRHGSKFFDVTIVLDNGTIVSRRKGEDVNEYTVTEEDKVAETFERLGNDVPDRIRQILGRVSLEIDGEEIPCTISRQEYGPFLLEEAAPVRAKLFGKISGLDIIDRAIKAIQSDALRTEREIRDSEAIVDEYIKKEDSLKEEFSLIDNPYKELSWRMKSLEEKVKRKAFLREKLDLIQAIENIKSKEEWKRKITKQALEDVEKHFAKLEGMLKRREALDEAFQEYGTLIVYMTGAHSLKKKAQQELDEALSDLKKIRKCPLCLSELSSKQVDRMVS
jgi:exonuclease SbcC